jgi:hypothetical protein
MLVDCRIAEYSKHFLRVPGDLRLQLQRASLDDTHVRSNAEVSDGGGHRALEFASQRRPPPFAQPKSSASFGTKLLANPVHEELDATAPGTDVNIKTLSVNE